MNAANGLLCLGRGADRAHLSLPSRFLSLPWRAVCAALWLFLVGAVVLPAQTSGSGTITGRVRNPSAGTYLNNARVALQGTNRETFTDAGGFYTLTGVPAGPATLVITHAGFAPRTLTLEVVPGTTTEQNLDLHIASARPSSADDEAIVLDAFVVQSNRETQAAAIAVNEQRVSATQKSVISADQFGTIPDANPGELMKWLPGVTVEYFANNIVGVSVRGLDAANTEIRFDDMPVASASTATASTPGRGRNFEMLGASSADIARVEIRKLRAPENSANALGGSINMIRRSAFEADRARLTYRALFTSDAEEFTLGKRPSIQDTAAIGWRPNAQVTWTHPVSKTFGYAITLGHNDNISRVHWSAPSLNFGTAAQGASAKARLDAGQQLTTASVYNPVVTQDLIHDNPKRDITDSASAKFDWRPTPDLKLSYTVGWSRYQERTSDDVRFTWSTGVQTNTNLNAVLGTPGTNSEHSVYGNLGTGAIRFDMREAWRNGIKPVLTQVLQSEWKRGDWTVSAAGSYSSSKHTFKDTEDGFFQSLTLNGSSLPNTGLGANTANPRAITVNLLERDAFIAQTVEAYAHTTGATTRGAAVDWQNLGNSYIGGAVSRPGQTFEDVAAFRLWTKRDFGFRNPFSVRVGFDYDDTYRNLQSYDAKLWTFVGADGVASTADDNAAQIAAQNVATERDSYYGSPAVPRISLRRLYDLYLAHPTWFRYRDAESIRFSSVEPYEVREKTYAGYLQLAGGFFNNRFTYVGGVRFERTEDWGLGNLDRGSGVLTGITDPVQRALTQYVRKGRVGESENDDYFPSLEANYNLTDNLIFRLGYAKTQAKNRFERSVIPSATFNYTAVTTGPNAGRAIGTITQPNLELKPWTADNYETHLEYYTDQGGVFSVGGFIKDIDNVQVQTSEWLDTLDKLAAFGQRAGVELDPGFLNFQGTTWLNQGQGRISGLEFDARQPLDAWLPEFLNGFSVIGSYNYNHLSKFAYLSSPTGNQSTDFQNFYETQVKASVTYRKGRFSGTIGLIRNGRVFRQNESVLNPDNTVAYAGERFYPAYTTVDFNAEYSLTSWARLFISGRNITDAQKTRYRVVEGAPGWSNFQIANNLGVTYTVGVTGTF